MAWAAVHCPLAKNNMHLWSPACSLQRTAGSIHGPHTSISLQALDLHPYLQWCGVNHNLGGDLKNWASVCGVYFGCTIMIILDASCDNHVEVIRVMLLTKQRKQPHLPAAAEEPAFWANMQMCSMLFCSQLISFWSTANQAAGLSRLKTTQVLRCIFSWHELQTPDTSTSQGQCQGLCMHSGNAPVFND